MLAKDSMDMVVGLVKGVSMVRATAILVSLLMLCMVFCGSAWAVEAPAKDWSVSALTDVGTSMAEVRVGRQIDADWAVGLFGQYFADDAAEPAKDWGVGVFGKLLVNPEASIPLANWLPALGEWLQLPESLKATTYLIGKGSVLPYDGDVDFAAAVGAGASVGPVVVEFVYDIIEGGDADNPMLTSGPTLWFGLAVAF